jgi:hypothetical protein
LTLHQSPNSIESPGSDAGAFCVVPNADMGNLGEGEGTMKRIQSNCLGVEQGSLVLFSDFQDGGVMWIGEGPREMRRAVSFSEPFREIPSVLVSFSMWDTDHKHNGRMDISAEHITFHGFEIVFKTWGDSRVARVRADWLALGELLSDEDWEIG